MPHTAEHWQVAQIHRPLYPVLGFCTPEFYLEIKKTCSSKNTNCLQYLEYHLDYKVFHPYGLPSPHFAILEATSEAALKKKFAPFITLLFSRRCRPLSNVPLSLLPPDCDPEYRAAVLSANSTQNYLRQLENFSASFATTKDTMPPHVCSHPKRQCEEDYRKKQAQKAANQAIQNRAARQAAQRQVDEDGDDDDDDDDGHGDDSRNGVHAGSDSDSDYDSDTSSDAQGAQHEVVVHHPNLPANPRTEWDVKFFREAEQFGRLPAAHDVPEHPDVASPWFHSGLCPCCPHRLVEMDAPEDGDALKNLPQAGLSCASSDWNMTLDHHKAPILHCRIHECQRCFFAYMGYTNISQIRALASSGPVLKHLPLTSALVTATKDGTYPTHADICEISSYALTILFDPKTRRMIPNNMDDIESYYQLSGTGLGLEEIEELSKKPAMKDNKTRAKLLASVVLSCFGDLMGAELISEKDYNEIYPKYADAMKKKCPWGDDTFLLELSDIKDIIWPFYGPYPNICDCGKPNCTSGEHDIEVYHRVLSFLRWTLRTMSNPEAYYRWNRGLASRNICCEHDVDEILERTERILEEIERQPIRGQKPITPFGPETEEEYLARTEHAASFQKNKTEMMESATDKSIEILQDQIRAAKLLSVARGAGILGPALLSSNSAVKDFPEKGTDKEKEAWVSKFEEHIWSVLASGGLKKEDNPDLKPQVHWFARYRARSVHNYQPSITRAERAANLADARKYLSDASLNFTQAQRDAMSLRDLRVDIAIRDLKKKGNSYIHMPPNMNVKQSEDYTKKTLKPVFQIFELAGMPEEETEYIARPLALFIFYAWYTVRTENILKAAPKRPTDAEMADWSDQAYNLSVNQIELEIYFRGKISEGARKAMLDGIVEACNPGERWLAGNVETIITNGLLPSK